MYNKDEIEDRIKAAVPDVYSHTSRETTTFSLGYAMVEILKHNAKGARGRAEGDDMEYPGLGRTYKFTEGDNGETEFIAWAVGILSTGRTIECGKGIGLREINNQPNYQSCGYFMADIPERMGGDDDEVPWDLDPDYQRDHVWTDEQAEAFVGHVLEGGAVPLIFLQRYDAPKNAPKGTDYWTLPIEVIDGKQRLTAIRRWVDGEIAASLTDGRRVWFKDTNEAERRGLPTVKVGFLDISREERLRFYLRLNRGGTVHSDQEIQNVRDLLAAEATS